MLCALAAGGTSDKGYVDYPVCCVCVVYAYCSCWTLTNHLRRADSCFASIVIVLQNKTDPKRQLLCLYCRTTNSPRWVCRMVRDRPKNPVYDIRAMIRLLRLVDCPVPVAAFPQVLTVTTGSNRLTIRGKVRCYSEFCESHRVRRPTLLVCVVLTPTSRGQSSSVSSKNRIIQQAPADCHQGRHAR